ncbi:MAG TPA: hypothetical protein PKC23_13160 [Candidatus Desulfobacillus sp.]|nr:hypothetical protein [Candidatus Desulfobacillus sp.]
MIERLFRWLLFAALLAAALLAVFVAWWLALLIALAVLAASALRRLFGGAPSRGAADTAGSSVIEGEFTEVADAGRRLDERDRTQP